MTYKIDFVENRKIYFIITLVIVALSVGSLLIQGLNLGIDFVSGTRLDISMDKPVDLAKAKQELEGLGYENPNARVGGPNKNILIFRLDKEITLQEKEKISQKLGSVFHTKVNVQEQVVDPIIGRELAKNAIISVLIASIGIIIYVTLRFEYRFAVAAILALFYDAIFTVGMFSILQLEVDIVFIAAILTIVGYSVNDTIVIFDRIRENLNIVKPTKWEELSKVVNDSIHQTLTRSINTVLTVVFAAFALWLLGGESISNFSLALLFGLISGAYSSIFVASQIWVSWKWRSMQKEKAGDKLAAE
ncbi:protein translocase subunit SecF [Lihuaxuella thermophila]|uniref:Protein-export membrane protein SecF n=1 Tax=Lihuaxuella thermophila TaxID=1173111 RepID=A0A1H8FV12_9BACL|nr:protein translocase subunit SecF [Lihuaxuella thermophila]SEN35479.1 preprotein translocase subunit SecF/SecD/SecF fusion protein [Lihuaxuella thermophila]